MSDPAVKQQVLLWSHVHAVLMLVTLVAVFAGLPLLFLVITVWLSLLWYLHQLRSTWHGARFFLGAANSITLFRLLLLSVVLLIYPFPSAVVCGWLLIVVLCLDGVDGLLARHYSESSLVGQYLDVEVDAFAVLGMSVLLWQILDLHWLVLLTGALRYLYLLMVRVFIHEERIEPKRQYASLIAVLVYIAMVLELAFNDSLTQWLLIFGLCLLGASFLRSFVYQWRGV